MEEQKHGAIEEDKSSFDQRIASRDCCVAVPASSAEKQPAHNRNLMDSWKPVATGWAEAVFGY